VSEEKNLREKCEGPQKICGPLEALMGYCYLVEDRYQRGVRSFGLESRSSGKMGRGVGVELAKRRRFYFTFCPICGGDVSKEWLTGEKVDD